MAPPTSDLPAVGSMWRLNCTWNCFPHISGKGFTTDPADWDPKRGGKLLGYGTICRVLLAGPDELLILTDNHHRLVRIAPHLFAYLMEPYT